MPLKYMYMLCAIGTSVSVVDDALKLMNILRPFSKC